MEDTAIDSEVKAKGFDILVKHLGKVEAERFIALIQRDSFDYTEWRKSYLHEQEEGTIEEISKRAMELRKKVKT